MEGILGDGERVGGRSVPREVLKGDVTALLLDLDGTLYTDAGPIPGAREALVSLKSRGVPFRFITNTTTRPRRSLVERLRRYGFDAEPEDVFTAVTAGLVSLADAGARVVAPFVATEALEDLQGFSLSGGVAPAGESPDAVLLGDMGDNWSVSMLNEAFRYVMNGARLIALQKNKYWLSNGELRLDSGPFVAAIEYAAGVEAVVCGKPERAFFFAAATAMPEVEGEHDFGGVVMVGDDLWGDVRGAQDCGMQGWLVTTGKYREDQLADSGVTPDRIIDSAATLADLI